MTSVSNQLIAQFEDRKRIAWHPVRAPYPWVISFTSETEKKTLLLTSKVYYSYPALVKTLPDGR